MDFCGASRAASRFLRYALLGALVLAAQPARAASVSFFIDTSNALPDDVHYLQVTIDDEGMAGAINFTVQVLAPLTDFAGGNFGIQKFSFNGEHLSSANVLFTGASVDGWKVANNNGSISEFGKFTNVLATTGNHRSDPLTFSIIGIDGDAIGDYLKGDPFFAMHVAGFSIGGESSAFFAGSVPVAVVPVPAAAWLFGAGLLGLIGVARRREKRN